MKGVNLGLFDFFLLCFCIELSQKVASLLEIVGSTNSQDSGD